MSQDHIVICSPASASVAPGWIFGLTLYPSRFGRSRPFIYAIDQHHEFSWKIDLRFDRLKILLQLCDTEERSRICSLVPDIEVRAVDKLKQERIDEFGKGRKSHFPETGLRCTPIQDPRIARYSNAAISGHEGDHYGGVPDKLFRFGQRVPAMARDCLRDGMQDRVRCVRMTSCHGDARPGIARRSFCQLTDQET